MAPLKSLEQEYPLIDSNFQNFCASHDIFSVEDLLLHDLDVLIAVADKQPTSSERLKQGITQVLSIIEGQHQPWLNGLDLLEDATQKKRVLSTGYEGIDLLLKGGLREGQLTELVGPSSSGKTQVCLKAAATIAKKHMSCVVYLDTGNSFSPQRIAWFIDQSVGALSSSQVDCRARQKVLDNIICYPVFGIFTMFSVLHQLEVNLRSQIWKTNHQVRCLVVDSISSLVTPVLGGGGPQGHMLMISAGYLLKKLAHEHDLAVLVTNHMVGGEGGLPKPALGESWKNVPHVRLLLYHNPRSNICNISVLKHPAIASGNAASFRISD